MLVTPLVHVFLKNYSLAMLYLFIEINTSTIFLLKLL